MQSDNRGLEPPARIGPYRLDRLLGSGGMGSVWRAWDERLQRWVALKQIRADATLQHGRERLWREARAVARLNHPAIVHVYDILEGTDDDWIVMELVQGKTIRRLLEEDSAFTPERAVELCRDMAEGLAEAHAQGILHRDLKATNVIVTASGRAKILDFGLAKEMPRDGILDERDQTITLSGNVLGTCYAMSPEQVLGRALDERSDLFSLGSLLYEMLTGRMPFRAETPALSLARVVEHNPIPVQQLRPEVPAEICELVDWLLRKEPEDRPTSASEVLAALSALQPPLQTTMAGASGWQRSVAPSRPAPALRADEATLVTLVEGPRRTADRPATDEHRQSGGEWRTVTVVCCGLIQLDRSSGDTSTLEIEALSEAAAIFENLGQEICRELSGTLGASLNRKLWLCFGYPQAHEDDAERAVRAARELQERFAALLGPARRLAIRAGIHTGPAVVVTRPSADSSLQPGDTFDIAAAVQSRVPAGRIAISAASRRLLGRKFTTLPLPAVQVGDLDATVAVYELGGPLEQGTGEHGVLLPLVNRDAEIHILLDRFRLASSGSGQAVLIAGDAGIGKSRLVRALAERLAAEAPVWLTAHGSAFAQNTPLSPVIQLLSQALFAAAASPEDRLHRLEEVLDEYGLPLSDHAALLGALLSLPVEGRYPPLVLSPEARRKRTLTAVVSLLGAMAERHPVVLVVEDLHWIDPSSLELLDLLLGEVASLPLLLVATFRPELTPPWRHQTSVTQLNLAGLSESHAAQLIQQMTEGKGLSAETRREIVVRTDGIPLFLEELTKAILEAAETEAPLREPSGIPFTLGSSLLARLDRLGEAKAVAQLAAVIGRTFTLEQLEALSWIKGAALRNALGRLLQAEIVHRRGPAHGMRYIFKHALIQDAAYLSLLESDRQQIHRRIAQVLQTDLPGAAEAEPELMAHHCERGGLTLEAVAYLEAAGRRAMQRSAKLEAVSHLRRALDLLLALPDTPELRKRELALRFALAPPLAALQGWGASEVAVNAERCVDLCRELGERGGLMPALCAVWSYHLLRADRQATIDLAAEIAGLAETPAQLFAGRSAQLATAFYSGRFAEALGLAEETLALYDPALHPELARGFGEQASLLPLVYHVLTLWMLGRPGEAVRLWDTVTARVEALGSPPFLIAYTLLFEMILWHHLREPERVDRASRRMLDLAREQEFAMLHALAHCGLGWAACRRGDLEGGAAQIRTGLDLFGATGSRLSWGYYVSFLIEAHLASGRLDEGLAAIRELLARPDRSDQRLDVFFDAELHRLEGELLYASGDARAAESSFRTAHGIARGQEARTFELRAAASLVRLLAGQGREGEALPLLADACQAHPEGFVTRDLTEARQLLHQPSLD